MTDEAARRGAEGEQDGGDDAVLEANAAFYRAFADRDLEAMDRIWAREAPVACTHPAWTVLTGREDVLKSWEGILTNPDAPSIEVRDAVAHRLGETAIVLCREIVEGAPIESTSGVSIDSSIRKTNVFVLEGGEWRIAHHHASAIARFLVSRSTETDPFRDRRN